MCIGYVRLRKVRTNNFKSYKISKTVKLFIKCLHAFSVNNAGTRLVILLPGDPHLLEGGERSQDGSSDPDGVFPLRRSNDLDLHCGRRKGCYLFLHSISHSWEHCSTSRQYNVRVKIRPDIHITLHDRLICLFVYSSCFHT